MGKDKHTFKEIEKERREMQVVLECIDKIISTIFVTEKERAVGGVLLSAEIKKLCEQVPIIARCIR